jgi:hypothetical protein
MKTEGMGQTLHTMEATWELQGIKGNLLDPSKGWVKVPILMHR